MKIDNMRSLITVLLMGIAGLTWAQNGPNCMGLFESYVQCSRKMTSPNDEVKYLLKTKQLVVPRDPSELPYSSISVLEMGGGKWRYVTDKMKYIASGEDMYVILEDERLIYRTVVPDIDPKARFNTYVSVQDSLLKHSKFVSCNESNDGDNLLLSMSVDEDIRSQFSISSWSVLMDAFTGEAKQVTINYTETSEYKRMVTDYLEVDTDYKGQIVDAKKELFVNGSDRLRQKYIGFTFLDSK